MFPPARMLIACDRMCCLDALRMPRMEWPGCRLVPTDAGPGCPMMELWRLPPAAKSSSSSSNTYVLQLSLAPVICNVQCFWVVGFISCDRRVTIPIAFARRSDLSTSFGSVTIRHGAYNNCFMVYEGGANTGGIVNGPLWLDNCDFGYHCGCLSYSGLRLSLSDKTTTRWESSTLLARMAGMSTTTTF
jgi:hypothetical protein